MAYKMVPARREGRPSRRSKPEKKEGSSGMLSRRSAGDLRQLSCDLAILLGNRMGWMGEAEKPPAAQLHHFIGMRQDRDHLTSIGLIDLLSERFWLQAAGGLVDQQQDTGNVQFLSDPDRDAGALVILLIGTHDDEQRVGDDQREQRFLIKARMGIDEQVVQLETGEQAAKAFGQLPRVIPLPQHTGDLPRLDAGWNEIDGAGACPDFIGGYVDGHLLDGPTVPQKIVQGRFDALAVQAAGYMEAWRLNVCINHTNPLPPLGQRSSQV